jgi:transcriptional regulator with XRE-family HTH domain
MDQTLKVIKRIREDKNISREEMSKILGISLSGYAKIERGEVDLTIARLTQISEILGFTPTQIMEMGDQNTLGIQDASLQKRAAQTPTEPSESSEKDLYIQFLEKRIFDLSKKLESSQ